MNQIEYGSRFSLPLLALTAASFLALSAQPADAYWRATGPYGGDAEIVRTIPQTRGMAVAGARNGLIFVSTNGGASWVNGGFPAQFAGVLHSLEVDPRTQGTWYAGMESANSWSSGVFKTTDAGRTWALLPGTKGLAVWSLALWPQNPDTIAAGTGSGVYLSRDAGASWKHISPPDDPELRPVVSLAFDPSNSNTIYAGTTHLPWRTADGGVTWKSIHTGMIDDSDVFSIQVDRHHPDRVFASACSGLYGSSDGASRWSKLDTLKGAFRTYLVAIDPNHPETLFAGTSDGLLRSPDGGRSWRKVSPEAVKSIAFDSWVPGRIFFASTTAGILLSTDGGNTVRASNFGFTNRNFTSLAASGNVLYSSSVYEPGSGGVYRTDSFGLRWTHEGNPSGDQLLQMTAAPDKPGSLFAAGYRSGLLESLDGGRTWTARKGPSEAGTPVALLALEKGALLVATTHGLFRSGEGGSWKLVSAKKIQTLQESGAKRIAAFSAGEAAVSDDRGLTWRDCGAPASGAAAPVFYGLAFDSGNPSTVLAATAGGLYRSADGCRSWDLVRDGLQQATAAPVLFHPSHRGEAYVCQGGRIFRSVDGGQRWLPFDDATPGNSGPSSLLVLPSAPDRLFALFPRRGVFSTMIGADVAPQPLPSGRPGTAAAKTHSDAPNSEVQGESHFK